LKLHPKETLKLGDYILLGANMLTRLSSEFVIVFFVLSGFSIAHSLRNDTTPAPFYKRRFIRLYPPYVTAILWAMLVALIVKAMFPSFFDATYKTPAFDRLAATNLLFNWKTFFFNLIYLPQMDGILRPLWSLTQEVIFYLLAPFVFRNKKSYYIGSTVAFVIVNILTQLRLVDYTILVNFLYYNFFFAVGALLYSNYEAVLEKAHFLVTKKALVVALALFFAMIVISLTNYAYTTPILAASMSIILIVHLLSNNVRINSLINVGRFSYTLYISHFPSIYLFLGLYYFFTKATPPYIFNNFIFIPCVFFCLTIAYLQYNLVEKRTKYFLDKLRKGESTKKLVTVNTN
jgi:peptidoglycan/LPS O-acetylase OafA/YrhL